MESSRTKIKNFVSHSVTGKTDDSFVGIKIKGNIVHFYYPECYNFSPDSSTAREDIVDLLRTIAIAKTYSSDSANTYDTRTNENEFALLSYLWIIRDYRANGFYVNREKIYAVNRSGRVDWKRTMQNQPIVQNGNIIYPNVIVSVKSNVDNLLVEIHKYCVKRSIDCIGWLFNLSSSGIETKPFNDTVKKVYVATLKQELSKTFDDNKKLLLKHMLNVICGLDDNNGNDGFVYGVDTYYYVFERMIDAIFGNKDIDIKSFNPKAEWRLVRNKFNPTPSSELCPDTILIADGNAFIIDSKFYRFGYTGDEADLPETTSIQKQITYGEFLKKNANAPKVINIFNAFLLPYDKTRKVFKSDDSLQYIGFANSLWKDNAENHEIIHAFLIDLKHVVKTWNKHTHSEDVKFLMEEIIKQNEIAKEKLSKG